MSSFIALLASWWLKSFVLLGAAWLGSALLRDGRAAQRHALWLAAVMGSMALPLASLVPGRPALGPSLSFAALAVPGASRGAETASVHSAWPTLAAVAWAVLAVALLARLIVGHARARRLLSGAREASVDGHILFVAESAVAPFTVGLVRPRIVVPTALLAWHREEQAAAVAHEAAHVARRDCLTQLLADVHAALGWIQPLAWVAQRQLALERELAADEEWPARQLCRPE